MDSVLSLPAFSQRSLHRFLLRSSSHLQFILYFWIASGLVGSLAGSQLVFLLLVYLLNLFLSYCSRICNRRPNKEDLHYAKLLTIFPTRSTRMLLPDVIFVRSCWDNTDRLRIRLQATVFQSEDGHVSGGMMKVIANYK